MRHALLALAIILVSAAALADENVDDTENYFSYCVDSCGAYLECHGTCLPLKIASISDCEAACRHNSDAFGPCADYTDCCEIMNCECGTADDDYCRKGDGGGKHRDRDGCSVIGVGPDAPLFAAMIAIGVFALALGRRAKKLR